MGWLLQVTSPMFRYTVDMVDALGAVLFELTVTTFMLYVTNVLAILEVMALWSK